MTQIGSGHTLFYERRTDQTVCILKEASGRACYGSLKKYLPLSGDFGELDPAIRQEIIRCFGTHPDLTLYKCNVCKAIYFDQRPAAR